MNNRDTYIQALSIISSCGCNLDCSYCRIAQSRHAKSAEMQKATIQALQDGTFLANVNKVLNRLDQSTAQIQNMAFWGQEPTLTLHYITEHLDEWFEYFPNWDEVMFSTNTVGFMDRIYDFIVGVDSKCKVPVFNMNIQLSYDGDYGTDNLRKGSSSSIHDNVRYLIEKLNNTNLNKVQLRLYHHGVLSLDLLNRLQTPEAIVEYSNHMVQWGNEFNKLNRNKNVHMDSEVDIALENPVEASTLTGLKLNNFCTIAERLNPKLKTSFTEDLGSVDPVYCLYRSLWTPFHMLGSALQDFDFRDLDQAIEIIMKDPIIRNSFYKRLNQIPYCGNGVGELKIMWDGTLINCQNHMFETNAELIHDKNELAEAVKKGLATHKFFVNGITDSDEDLDKYFALFDIAKNTSFEFTLQNTIMLMKFLSITGQIDESYKDHYKLVKHAFLVAVIGCCEYNNYVMTGSFFMRHTGYIRFVCNGYLDKAIKEFNTREGGYI